MNDAEHNDSPELQESRPPVGRTSLDDSEQEDEEERLFGDLSKAKIEERDSLGGYEITVDSGMTIAYKHLSFEERQYAQAFIGQYHQQMQDGSGLATSNALDNLRRLIAIGIIGYKEDGRLVEFGGNTPQEEAQEIDAFLQENLTMPDRIQIMYAVSEAEAGDQEGNPTPTNREQRRAADQ